MTEAIQTQGDQQTEPAIEITETAAEKLQEQIDGFDGEVQALRLIVDAGGCCGLRYAMAFATGDPEDFEQVVETDVVPIYIENRALEVVQGSTIDWMENMMGAGFRVDNPNEEEVNACGC